VLENDCDAVAYASISRQVNALEVIVRSNPVIRPLLDRLEDLQLPAWYVGAGAIAQTVWNHLHDFPATHGINDYDIVYFDRHDLTKASEDAIEATIAAWVDVGTAKLDVTNQARVHTWYEQRFGRPLSAYRSSEHAIATWPTTATSVGVRSNQNGFEVCAPFGLTDLFAMVVRPNAKLVSQAVYQAKAERWRHMWPRLTVLPWPTE
jgi:uncharacterized protein